MNKITLAAVLLFTLQSYAQNIEKSDPDSAKMEELKEQIEAEILQELSEGSPSEEEEETEEGAPSLLRWSRFGLNGYGVVNYYNYDYDTDPNLKDKLDAERLNLYLTYKFSDRISFKSEIEFEHGGTGASLEFDNQEEFGEFEQEIEQGGEVKVEQINIDFKIKPYFNIRAGRLKMYVGLAQNLDEPTHYFTTHRQEMENEILPLGWYENGFEFYGTFARHFNYKVYVVSGLDASGFSSRSWIKWGYQTRFDMVNAESFAFAGRLDYKFGYSKNTYVGVSAYINNAAANRPKNDMDESAYVTLAEAHLTYDERNLRFNTMFLYGNLENSNIVSHKNANLSNNLGVKRNPVGKNALGFSAEIGYDIMPLLNSASSQRLYPFARYDYYDTMQDTEGSIVDNPRWQRSVITGGFNWFVFPEIAVKAQYSDRRLGSENYNQSTLQYTGEKQHERTFSLGLGFEF